MCHSNRKLLGTHTRNVCLQNAKVKNYGKLLVCTLIRIEFPRSQKWKRCNVNLAKHLIFHSLREAVMSFAYEIRIAFI